MASANSCQMFVGRFTNLQSAAEAHATCSISHPLVRSSRLSRTLLFPGKSLSIGLRRRVPLPFAKEMARRPVLTHAILNVPEKRLPAKKPFIPKRRRQQEPSGGAFGAGKEELSEEESEVEPDDEESDAEEMDDVTLGELVDMIKDAEQNILVLNQVRSRALQELEQARTDNDTLQNQLKVFQARLAESDAKLNMAAQTKQKSSLLETEVKILQEQLETVGATAEEVEALNEKISALQVLLAESEAKIANLGGVENENAKLNERIAQLQAELVTANEEERRVTTEMEKKIEAAHVQMKHLEELLAQKDREITDLSEAKSSNILLMEEIAMMKEIREKNEIEVERAKVAFERSEEQLEEVKGALEHSQVEVERVKEALYSSKNEVESARVIIVEREDEVRRVKAALEKSEQEVEGMKVTLKESEDGVKMVNEALVNSENEVKRLKMTLDMKEAGVNTVTVALANSEFEVENLKKALYERESELEVVKVELEKSKDEIEWIKNTLVERESGVETVKAALAKSENEVKRLMAALDEKEAGVETATVALVKSESEMERLKMALKESEAEVEVLKAEFDKSKDEVDRLKQSLVTRESGVEMVTVALDKSENKVEILKTALANSETEVEKVKAALSLSENEVERLKLALEKGESGVEVVTTALDKSKNEVEKLAIALEKSENEVEMIKSALEKSENELKKSKVALKESETEVNQARVSSQKLLQQAGDVEKGFEKLKVEKQLLEERLKQAEARVAILQSNSTEKNLELENQRLQSMSESLHAKVKGLEAKVAEVEKVDVSLSEMEEELEAMRELVSQSGRLEKVAVDVSQRNVDLQAQIKNLQGRLERMEEEKGIYQKQVLILKEELLQSDDMMRAQLEMFQREVEATRMSLMEAERKLESYVQEEGEERGYEVPVGEMPWDFWSSLFLKVDDLFLQKLLTVEELAGLQELVWKRNSRLRDIWESLEFSSDSSIASGMRGLVKPKTERKLHILHIAAEMAPVAKVGGLGDVVTGLCRALQAKGHLVEIILPKYDCMDYSRIQDLKLVKLDIKSFFDGEMHSNKIWHGLVEGLPVYFIEPLHPGRFFWRGTFYGCNDDFKRFTYFCRAALEFMVRANKRPDIIHTHDWQTAAVAPLYWDFCVPKGFNSAQLAFTSHNFEYQGSEHASALASCGLDVARHNVPERMQDNFAHDRINLMKGGIVFSNLVTTVSPTYAMEVRGPEGGKGLHLTLGQYAHKFVGVLNGIDFDVWNPATDPLIDTPYSADDLAGKEANKAALRAQLRFSSSGADAHKPIVGCITRLVPQKGVHLIRHAIYRTLEKGGQFVLLGSSPVPDIQKDFESIQQQFQNDPNIRLVLKYDEGLSHLIYAGCDIFIIPSLFEPCGLTQLIAMRYGVIPVVRKTGGLADSVFDVDDSSIPLEKKNGFSFSATDAPGLNYALDRAISYYYNRPDWWGDLVARTMAMNFSWDESSEQYIRLYQKIMKNKLA